MPSFIQHDRAPSRPASAEGGAAKHRSAAPAHAPAADTLAASLNESSRSQSLTVLRAALDESPHVQSLQRIGGALNRMPEREEAEPDQSRPEAIAQFAAIQHHAGKPGDPPPVEKKNNATGLPDRLKDGVEQLSGLAMDDVRVHYNSEKPAAVQAHAYAQGTDIHVAPGQEKHLPHEAWHVVQQKQGRVKPTLQLKGVAINDDGGLEREADRMGRQALGTVQRTGDSPGSTVIPGNQDMETSSPTEIDAPGRKRTKASSRRTIGLDPVQRIIIFNGKPSKKGVVPKALVHGNSEKDLKVLANSNTEHDLGTQGGAAAAPLIKAALELETKDTKVDVSKQSKEKTVKPLIELKPHIAGEKNGTGGHLLLLMQETHTNKLVYEGDESDAGVWTCRWSLRKDSAGKNKNKNQDTKDAKEDDLEFPLKESTMFPASWTWDRLVRELYGYTREGDKLVLKNGIKVHQAGDTFYPDV